MHPKERPRCDPIGKKIDNISHDSFLFGIARIQLWMQPNLASAVRRLRVLGLVGIFYPSLAASFVEARLD